MEWARLAAGISGAFVVAGTLGSAVRTVVLPRAIPAIISRRVFLAMRVLFRVRVGRKANYQRVDAVMALYGPVSLLTLLVVWLGLVLGGYVLVYWALGVGGWRAAFELSGSSLFTLGFAHAESAPAIALALTEAGIGLILLALLITYLPSIYGAFSRREAAIAMLEVRAGSRNVAASTFEMISRAWAVHGFSTLSETWQMWERWFVELEESHTSFASLAFFRSQQPERHWVVAAGTILDAAALANSSIEGGWSPEGAYCLRAGYLALRRIAGFFRVPFDEDPHPDDPIAVTRAEYDEMMDNLAESGVPLVADRDQAWRDFAGWRVNYDTVLLALASLTVTPPTPWIGDRSPMIASEAAHTSGVRR
jgi:hypothetical protein